MQASGGGGVSNLALYVGTMFREVATQGWGQFFPFPVLEIQCWEKERTHRPAPVRNFLCRKNWGPQKNDFGGGSCFRGFYRVLVSTTGLESFFFGVGKVLHKIFFLLVVVYTFFFSSATIERNSEKFSKFSRDLPRPGKSNEMGALKRGLRVLVLNCPQLPTSVDENSLNERAQGQRAPNPRPNLHTAPFE